MRIRELFFHDFRSFRGPHPISFVDPLTDTVRPISVLAGTNGSGKTTILDSVEALLDFALDPDRPPDLVREPPWRQVSSVLAIEMIAAENGQPASVVVLPSLQHRGRRHLAGAIERDGPTWFAVGPKRHSGPLSAPASRPSAGDRCRQTRSISSN